MPRALLATWRAVPAADRRRAMAQWRERRDRLTAAGCRFWVYESSSEPGRFLEFTEARDTTALEQGCALVGVKLLTASVLNEVELI